MHVGGRGVARRAGVHHQDLAAGAGQDQGCGQAGGASADDDYVVLAHGSRLEPCGRDRLGTLLFLGNGSQMSLRGRHVSGAIAAALDQVGAPAQATSARSVG